MYGLHGKTQFGSDFRLQCIITPLTWLELRSTTIPTGRRADHGGRQQCFRRYCRRNFGSVVHIKSCRIFTINSIVDLGALCGHVAGVNNTSSQRVAHSICIDPQQYLLAVVRFQHTDAKSTHAQSICF